MKRGNTIFYIVGIIGILFIISPLLLHIPFIKQIYTIYLQSINTIDYKASYIETVSYTHLTLPTICSV